MQYLVQLLTEFQVTWAAVGDAATHGSLSLLVAALLIACAFEFINGFHDTANAVATVIYTRSLKPWLAVGWSGVCNFLGVILGGTAVAMGILKLLPLELLVTHDTHAALAMVFALLIAAIAWNFGTWYLALPASSSHTLIGSILGIGLANAYVSGLPLGSGVNWSKAGEIGLALLISPLFGFSMAALLLLAAKRLAPDPVFHARPPENKAPPWRVRAALIATSTGVSFAHGSNDGQKGIGLIMLVLITIVPGEFALNATATNYELARVRVASERLEALLELSTVAQVRPHADPGKLLADAALSARVASSHPRLVTALPKEVVEIVENLRQISATLNLKPALESLNAFERLELRGEILKVDRALSKLERDPGAALPAMAAWTEIQAERKSLKSLTDYAPAWVVLAVALSLGAGTMIGWRRIVHTLGERIGKSHLTYAQGASAELVAMSTIGVSAIAGLPVSTTHVLSSGIAGTMVAGRSGLQVRTVKSILWAWVLTLPASMALSAGFYLLLLKLA